jgi:NAD(P)-dependent dehydrogenase (short-subunit alcohol dehydrogenase family)
MSRQTTQDPKQAGPKPPFPEQQQAPPGLESEMQPRPDYGEETYVGHDRLAGRRAIVTGADSGIGRAVALGYAREGADVVVSYLEEHSDARETAAAVEGAGRRAILVPGDIGDEQVCNEIVETAVDQLGGVEILVNNAAYQMEHDSFLDIPSTELEFVFRTNILSMFHLCKACVPCMREGSAIINTTSVQAFQPSPTLLHYATTKGAIVTFTKGLAQELIGRGIRVNAVAPGPVWTPLIAMSFPPEKVASFGEDNPMERPAQPAELAPLYVFLASDEARYVVGEVLGATGGKVLPS